MPDQNIKVADREPGTEPDHDRDFADEPEPGITLPPPRRDGGAGRRQWSVRYPFVALTLYYLVLIGGMLVLARGSAPVREAFFSPAVVPIVSQGEALLTGEAQSVGTVPVVGDAVTSAVRRSLTTLLVILGAMLLIVPVTWVYMQAKRLRYDPALVRSVVILPIVVAGIAMVVKNSLALAFSLAGIVAAVRFRNTLKDPRDAVYIFLVIGIGLASGVQALDVALVMSIVFNFVVLTLWRFNIGSIYGGGYGRTGVMSTGDAGLLVAQVSSVRKQIRRSLLDDAEGMKTDGILLVHTDEVDLARHTVQEALGEMAREWRLIRVVPRTEEVSTLEYVVRLKKKSTPADLVGALDERWSAQVMAAEYFPFRARENDRRDDAEEEDE